MKTINTLRGLALIAFSLLASSPSIKAASTAVGSAPATAAPQPDGAQRVPVFFYNNTGYNNIGIHALQFATEDAPFRKLDNTTKLTCLDYVIIEHADDNVFNFAVSVGSKIIGIFKISTTSALPADIRMFPALQPSTLCLVLERTEVGSVIIKSGWFELTPDTMRADRGVTGRTNRCIKHLSRKVRESDFDAASIVNFPVAPDAACVPAVQCIQEEENDDVLPGCCNARDAALEDMLNAVGNAVVTGSEAGSTEAITGMLAHLDLEYAAQDQAAEAARLATARSVFNPLRLVLGDGVAAPVVEKPRTLVTQNADSAVAFAIMLALGDNADLTSVPGYVASTTPAQVAEAATTTANKPA
jgi:hypothetical protein